MKNKSTPGGRDGKTLWAEQLLESIDRLGVDTHLSTGLDLVRKRKVGDLQVTKGSFFARVQMERQRGFWVRFIMEPIPQEVWNEIVPRLSRQAAVIGNLLSSHLPDEIEDALQERGYSYLGGADQTMSVSCE